MLTLWDLYPETYVLLLYLYTGIEHVAVQMVPIATILATLRSALSNGSMTCLGHLSLPCVRIQRWNVGLRMIILDDFSAQVNSLGMT